MAYQEHIKRCDEPKYLPFARSRLRALRETGLEYASQVFEIGGSVVSISIKAGDGYISITGTSLDTLYMDSGLVDVISVGENSPNRYLPGVLHETDSVAQYNAPFSLVPPETQWRTKPAPPKNIGQISGDLDKGEEFKGRVPLDAQSAGSFKPQEVETTPSTDPKTYHLITDDEGLYEKKKLARKCPASMFTGRCRLYIQAVYGGHLYIYSAQGKVSTSRPSLVPSLNASARPELLMPSYRTEAEIKADALAGVLDPEVRIDTHTGVFLDPETGKHWLFKPGEDTIDVYPLISDAIGEGLRKILKPSYTGKDALTSEEDREHLEAYILSRCKPAVRQVRNIPLGGSVNGWACGYGWHWNWTGNTADIVTNAVYFQEYSSLHNWYGNESTHHRFTLTKTQIRDEKGVITDTQFSSAYTKVSGPNKWAVNRIFWCIAEPGWATGGMDKSTPLYSKMQAGTSPFYVFYRRDELIVCTITVSYNAAATIYNESYGFQGFSRRATLGGGEGFGELETDDSAYYTVSFQCGSVTTPAAPLKSSRGQKAVISGSNGSVVRAFDAGSLYQASISYAVGPALSFSNDHAVVTIAARTRGQPATITTTFSDTSSTTTKSYSPTSTIIIPFYDAEAVFVNYSNTTTTGFTGIGVVTYGNSNFHVVSYPQFADGFGFGDDYIATNWWGFGSGGTFTSTISTTNPADTTTVVTDTNSVLISKAGVTPATMNDISPFHDFLVETTGVGYGVLSGTRTTLPTVLPGEHGAKIGTTIDANEPVLVGWV